MPDLVEGVRDQLVQVVFNLVLNAIDATGKNGAVTVTAERAAEGHGWAVRLTVSDDGPGVPADVLPRLFRPYFTTKKQGTGLGLFVVRRIAEAHGGRAEVGNAAGGGAAVTVTLPAADKTAGDRPEPVAAGPPAAVPTGAPFP